MSRGSRWLGELAANEAQVYVRGRYVDPWAIPAVDAAMDARNAYRGGRDAYRGLMGVATLERGSRFGSGTGSPRGLQDSGTGSGGPRVGGQWFHGAGDRHDAIAAIDRTAQALARDLDTVPANLAAWVSNSARPELELWTAFRDVLSASASALFATKWIVIDEWRDRIMDLRNLVGVAGGTVAAPPIPELPQTLWERAEHGGGDTFDRWLTIARGSAYTILAMTGVYGLFVALSSLKRVKLVEKTLAEPASEEEAEAQGEAAAEVEQHGHEAT
jgi:hypothetical protein